MVAIAERRGGEGTLEAPGVGPRVLRSANAAALADIQDKLDIGRGKPLEERVASKPVDADRGDRGWCWWRVGGDVHRKA